jgi:hypothetical protein
VTRLHQCVTWRLSPRCRAGGPVSLATDNPQEPVVAHGRAERVTSPEALAAMLAAENAKYRTDYGADMVDPARNSVYALRLDWVFALDASDFAGSPTRFTFGRATAL